MKTNGEDTRWLRLTNRNVDGGNNWLWTMGDLCFGGAEMIWAALSRLLTLFR